MLIVNVFCVTQKCKMDQTPNRSEPFVHNFQQVIEFATWNHHTVASPNELIHGSTSVWLSMCSLGVFVACYLFLVFVSCTAAIPNDENINYSHKFALQIIKIGDFSSKDGVCGMHTRVGIASGFNFGNVHIAKCTISLRERACVCVCV